MKQWAYRRLLSGVSASASINISSSKIISYHQRNGINEKLMAKALINGVIWLAKIMAQWRNGEW